MAIVQMAFSGKPKVYNGRCAICNRPLSNPESVNRGIGPVCAGKNTNCDVGHHTRHFEDGFLPDLPMKPEGVHLKFNKPEGVFYTNVPHLTVSHSPSGFCWGYGGSGPADLALNILEHALGLLGWNGPREKCGMGQTCFLLAWQLHQSFKWDWIAPMPRKGGHIPWHVITDLLVPMMKGEENHEAN